MNALNPHLPSTGRWMLLLPIAGVMGCAETPSYGPAGYYDYGYPYYYPYYYGYPEGDGTPPQPPQPPEPPKFTPPHVGPPDLHPPVPGPPPDFRRPHVMDSAPRSTPSSPQRKQQAPR